MTHIKAELVRRNYEEYRERVDPKEAPGTVIADMIADLLHLAEVEQTDEYKESGEYLAPDEILAQALGNFSEESEQTEEDELREVVELFRGNPWNTPREPREVWTEGSNAVE